MAKHYDSESVTLKVTCPECQHEHSVDVVADVEVESYLKVKEA